MLGMGYFSSMPFISDDVSPRSWSVYGNIFGSCSTDKTLTFILLFFSVLQNKTLSGVGMDSGVELPFDVSILVFTSY